MNVYCMCSGESKIDSALEKILTNYIFELNRLCMSVRVFVCVCVCVCLCVCVSVCVCV